MLAIPGYSGFRRTLDKDLLTEKPGDSRAKRDGKFSRAGVSVVYSTLPDSMTAKISSNNEAAASTVRPEHYRPPDRRGVMAERDTHKVVEKKFIARSEASASFPNYVGELHKLMSHSEVDYKAAFELLDKDKSGYVDIRELRPLLWKVHGSEPTNRELNLFFAYFDKNKDSKISWPEFREGLKSVIEHMRKESSYVAKRHIKAPFYQAPEKRAIADEVVASRMQHDVGDYGYLPGERPIVEGSGMNSTTKDLFDGTSKRSLHPPGYGGQIAGAPYNEHAIKHSLGTKERETFHAKTHLTLTVKDTMPGYSGHRPMEIPRMKKEGQFADTESLAADFLVTQYWKTRSDKAKAGGK